MQLRAIQVFLAASVSVVIAAFAASLSLFDGWNRVMDNAGSVVFGDLNIVTTTAGCLAGSSGIDAWGNLCSTWVGVGDSYPGPNFNYPSFWASGPALLGVDSSHTFIIGQVMIFSFAVAVFFLVLLSVVGRTITSRFFFLVLVIFSPPTFLLLERANSDSIIFILIVGACLALSLKRNWLGSVLVGFAVVLKLFPIGAVVALLGLRGRRRYFLIGSVIAVAGISSYAAELPYILGRTPQMTERSFGSAVVPSALFSGLGIEGLGGLTPRFVGIAVFLALAVIVHVTLSSSSRLLRGVSREWDCFIEELGLDPIARNLFVLGTATFIPAYVAGANFDYRLVFLLPTVAALTRMRDSNESFALALLVGLAAVFALSNAPTNYGFYYAADMGLLVVAPILAIAVVRLILAGKPLHIGRDN